MNPIKLGWRQRFREWVENCYWSWRNCWDFRFGAYNDDIDRLAFFEELSFGHIQMKDEWLMLQPNFDPYNLSGRDPYYTHTLRK